MQNTKFIPASSDYTKYINAYTIWYLLRPLKNIYLYCVSESSIYLLLQKAHTQAVLCKLQIIQNNIK